MKSSNIMSNRFTQIYLKFQENNGHFGRKNQLYTYKEEKRSNKSNKIATTATRFIQNSKTMSRPKCVHS